MDPQLPLPSSDLITYLAPAPTGAGILICPGGSYEKLALDHEGHQAAEWWQRRGVSAFILQYRHAPLYLYPVPLLDALDALHYLHANAPALALDPARIGIMGFSAGGHLAALVCTAPDAPLRPAFAILAYPVITLDGPFAHLRSANNLLGPNPAPDLLHSVSAHVRVSSTVPPTFLFHCQADNSVPVENSRLYHQALTSHGVPSYFLLAPDGRHGIGMAVDEPPPLCRWPETMYSWLGGLGLL